jgi:hypothetical protein
MLLVARSCVSSVVAPTADTSDGMAFASRGISVMAAYYGPPQNGFQTSGGLHVIQETGVGECVAGRFEQFVGFRL